MEVKEVSFHCFHHLPDLPHHFEPVQEPLGLISAVFGWPGNGL